MSAITLGPNGLPVQLTPVLPQTPPNSLLQAPAPQPPIAVAPAERQPNPGAAKDTLARRDGGGQSGNARGRVLDLKA